MYVIKYYNYNHVSGYDEDDTGIVYEDLNTAKKELLNVLMEDENLYEEDATCRVAKDLMSAHTTGRHDDYCDYWIEEYIPHDICKDKYRDITIDELTDIFADITEDNPTLQVTIE